MLDFHTSWQSRCYGLRQPPLLNEEPPANPDETAEARTFRVVLFGMRAQNFPIGIDNSNLRLAKQ